MSDFRGRVLHTIVRTSPEGTPTGVEHHWEEPTWPGDQLPPDVTVGRAPLPPPGPDPDTASVAEKYASGFWPLGARSQAEADDAMSHRDTTHLSDQYRRCRAVEHVLGLGGWDARTLRIGPYDHFVVYDREDFHNGPYAASFGYQATGRWHFHHKLPTDGLGEWNGIGQPLGDADSTPQQVADAFSRIDQPTTGGARSCAPRDPHRGGRRGRRSAIPFPGRDGPGSPEADRPRVDAASLGPPHRRSHAVGR